MKLEMNAPPPGYWAHPDIENLIARLIALDHTGALSKSEDLRVIAGISAIEAEIDQYRLLLGNLSMSGALPDPGCRPRRGDFINSPWTRESAIKLLGYIHRIRELVERLEAKYGLAPESSRRLESVERSPYSAFVEPPECCSMKNDVSEAETYFCALTGRRIDEAQLGMRHPIYEAIEEHRASDDMGRAEE